MASVSGRLDFSFPDPFATFARTINLATQFSISDLLPLDCLHIHS